MDSTGPLDYMIMEAAITGSLGNGAHTQVVDVEEPLDCVITKEAAAAVPAASLFTGDLSSQGEELKVVFSTTRDVRDAQCSGVPSEVHDRLTTI
ncbi:hypothetical protein LIER_15862 [Lithospermum erythrorhizon]|uniref:Uncharacterized protein n=1 Tax=Lithospermum erythrorhizon TaxID=34254 RepID=A0AAV3Q6D7_LITER